MRQKIKPFSRNLPNVMKGDGLENSLPFFPRHWNEKHNRAIILSFVNLTDDTFTSICLKKRFENFSQSLEQQQQQAAYLLIASFGNGFLWLVFMLTHFFSTSRKAR